MSDDEFEDEDYTPRIVILGAGPIGLEAALYARYLGYEVAVLEKETAASNVMKWGHVKMFSPFAMNRSSLGMAALKAQLPENDWPEADALLTGAEYTEKYLLPLSQSDLLAGCIHENVEVLSVARDGILKSDKIDSREDFPFRVLVQSAEGQDIIDADFVIDATGVYCCPNHLGHGGQPAIGESELSENFWRHVPDVLGKDRDSFAGKRVLVVGNGYSAATTIAQLAELKQDASETEITWVTRRESVEAGPMPIVASDVLLERNRLSEQANAATGSAVKHVDQTGVLEATHAGDHIRVVLGGKLSGEHEFDAIVSCTGYRPDLSLVRELQVDWCESTESPRATANWFCGLGEIDAVKQESPGVAAWSTTEPNFYVIGSKSFGRNSNFLLSLGLQQIRDLYSVIADREDLDLYQTMENFA